ncbi:hypothetical protein [Ancylobacter amanitiformis]|uniref:Uncharacterized protein n=1 Tax=Ancylobacter amanitiformis TaxID=217069 RepID=A0ABU0LWF2_9HYPH|nr:hypothetical protein [Ancylobacter amanitiformis]MDQ0513009.1 hypothetical protein [Ancylobacter amanitiformis]
MELIRYHMSLILIQLAALVAPPAFRPRFITIKQSLCSMIEMLRER